MPKSSNTAWVEWNAIRTDLALEKLGVRGVLNGPEDAVLQARIIRDTLVDSFRATINLAAACKDMGKIPSEEAEKIFARINKAVDALRKTSTTEEWLIMSLSDVTPETAIFLLTEMRPKDAYISPLGYIESLFNIQPKEFSFGEDEEMGNGNFDPPF
ncbi:hypothetical protein UFOVP967_57 [uncultured Caudovirales phage]|uniref:Uncharacterized protein n=1 Tax=uncultured Caudovirales phage TaxID=2100421 RepID=A0A6J5QHG4_9CAUD|nr:hypothetical protein UFOVP521_59 [uncultured Caudovirales phage]CAB4167500.1 hypothetical protein UFOVP856_31 [uncultured Caudovirales phage]CAB4174522.1 hypothetical protein UFOVP967_57 [uncultured Caudovirales phage]CAB4180405.1 hypothetical protein UFOVP1036_24 [uncultured Caudovirales phage]CAB4186240.1 hypothetical protein UFOVP1132_43 [uncultured Caudovirales phage]